MATKVFAPKSFSYKHIQFKLGFAYVTDAEIDELKHVDPSVAVIVDRGGDPLNCTSAQITIDSPINPEFRQLLPPSEPVGEPVEEAEPEEAEPEEAEHPSMDWTKEQMKEYMDANGISYNSGDTKSDLMQKIDLAKQ